MNKRFAAITLVTAVVAGACSEPVLIAQVTLSGDGTRLEIIFDSCNAPLDVDVTESDEAVTISVGRIDRELLSRNDCQDLRIHQLSSVLADRPVIDGATGALISVLSSLSADESLWPYDSSRFSEEGYEAALDDMVSCFMRRDPQVTAWVFHSLDYKWYSWSKEPDANGTVSTTALGTLRSGAPCPPQVVHPHHDGCLWASLRGLEGRDRGAPGDESMNGNGPLDEASREISRPLRALRTTGEK